MGLAPNLAFPTRGPLQGLYLPSRVGLYSSSL